MYKKSACVKHRRVVGKLYVLIRTKRKKAYNGYYLNKTVQHVQCYLMNNNQVSWLYNYTLYY